MNLCHKVVIEGKTRGIALNYHASWVIRSRVDSAKFWCKHIQNDLGRIEIGSFKPHSGVVYEACGHILLAVLT